MGGTLFVGVEDDGTITGARPRHPNGITDVRLVDAMLASGTIPSATTTTQLLRIGERSVLAIEVARSATPVSNSQGTYKKRVIGSDGKPACIPYPYHEMQASNAPAFAVDFSARVLPGATWEDLDPLEFARLRNVIRSNAGRADASLSQLTDADMCRALGLVEGGGGTDRAERITVAGMLMLGKEEALRNFVPTHEVAFQVRRGTTVEVNDFFRRPLVWMAEELQRRFDARNREEEMEFGPFRIGIPDYSSEGYREAVNNALVHRDYATLSAVHVQWNRDGIAVMSPGGLVQGVTIQNLLVAQPRPRNRVLADAFKRIGLVERTGRGVDKIYEGQLRYGRPAPDYSLTTSESVQVNLRGGAANLALARWFIERYSAEEPATVEDMIVINALESDRYLTVERAAAVLQRDASQARQFLERLVDKGALEVQEQRRRGRIYQLSSETYAAIGKSTAYTRRKGFTSTQQEHMILSHLETYETITRGEIAELCHLDDDNTRNLIRRLRRQGLLVLQGTGRSATYRLAQPNPWAQSNPPK